MDYQLIQELHEIKDGRYIKWLKLDEKKWKNGFVIKVNIEEDGARILVKKGKYLITCIYDESIIYQKLSLDEQLITRIESLL
jgi:hypothetical protein|uniref:Uncharacterized protein n=1 Tax=viral metagenome TaxID=1070528 RepID=A0A6C0HY95_9ZZZZ